MHTCTSHVRMHIAIEPHAFYAATRVYMQQLAM